MHPYNKELLENTFLHREAESLRRAGFMDDKQLRFIEDHLPALNGQRHFLLRAGLFILGCFLISSFTSLFGLVFLATHDYKITLLIDVVLGFAALEFIIREMKYYANGIDDAFLLGSQIAASVLLFVIVDNWKLSYLLLYPVAGLCALCCIRYIDSLSAFLACAVLSAAVAMTVLQSGPVGKQLLPFFMMALAGAIYGLQHLLRYVLQTNSYFKQSLQVLSLFGLALFYLSCNYLVVREGNAALLDATLAPGSDIPLAWLFYGLTFAVPVAYLYFSLRLHDRPMLWTGLFALAFSIFSIRYYYHIIPVEWALLGGGLLLFGLSIFAIRKLRGRTNGLTVEPDRLDGNNELLSLETIAVVQSFAVKPAEPKPQGPEFGGGSFGGGGAGSNF